MSPLAGNLSDQGNVKVVVLGATVALTSVLIAGWMLHYGDIPGGFGTLVLALAGVLIVAIGRSEPS